MGTTKVLTPKGVIDCEVLREKNGYYEVQLFDAKVCFHIKSGTAHPATTPPEYLSYLLWRDGMKQVLTDF